jgi:hypothetical protein
MVSNIKLNFFILSALSEMELASHQANAQTKEELLVEIVLLGKTLCLILHKTCSLKFNFSTRVIPILTFLALECAVCFCIQQLEAPSIRTAPT